MTDGSLVPTQSEQVDQLATALAKAQGMIKGAKKDSVNPFFKSSYADLGSVWDAVREPFKITGLSVVQLPGYENGVTTLTTILLHTSGQWIKGTAGAPSTRAGKDGSVLPADAQSVGSVLTYLRRYSLAAVAGVVQEDDDGQGASHRPLNRMPQALESEEGERFQKITNETPCPYDPKKRSLKEYTVKQLNFLVDSLAPKASEGDDTATAWMIATQDELKRREKVA